MFPYKKIVIYYLLIFQKCVHNQAWTGPPGRRVISLWAVGIERLWAGVKSYVERLLYQKLIRKTKLILETELKQIEFKFEKRSSLSAEKSIVKCVAISYIKK